MDESRGCSGAARAAPTDEDDAAAGMEAWCCVQLEFGLEFDDA